MSTRKLDAWLDAGLIDQATRDRIVAYEDQHSRPIALWAVIGIGALAIGLGVISVVAANWEDVPGQVRLAIHLLLFAGLAGFIGLRGDRLEKDHPWGLEAALFVLGVLGMTFFGHIGQVYQTASPLWRPLAAALALFGPIVLLRGQSWVTAMLFMGTLVATCWEYASTFDAFFFGKLQEAPFLWLSVVTAFPVLLAAPAAWLRSRSNRSVFWKRLEQLAVIYAVVCASLLCILASIGESDKGYFGLAAQSIRGAIAVVTAGLILFARPGRSGQATGLVFVSVAFACFLAHPFADQTLMAGLLFMALWIAIAAAALFAGWRGVFQVAVAVVAFRLIVLSFELASDLLMSGFGLIIAGFMILGIAFAAFKVSRKFAPERHRSDEEAET